MNLQELNNKYSVYMRILLEEEQKKVEKLKKRFSILLFFVFTLLTLSVVFCLSTVKLQEQNFMLQNENKELLSQIEVLKEEKQKNVIKTKDIRELILNLSNDSIKAEQLVYEETKDAENANQSLTEVSYNVTDNYNFKSYMDYRCITNKKSKQWQIVSESAPDNNGLMMFENKYYCIALGSAFGNVGDKMLIKLSNGKEFYAIKADAKADIHTTIEKGKISADGSIAEFIIDKNNLNRTVRKMGNVSALDNFSGSIVSISILSNM